MATTSMDDSGMNDLGLNDSGTKHFECRGVGLFRQGITSEARLVATSVGRKYVLEDLLDKLKANADKRSNQHFVFIGPRGIGKTHFLTLIENALKKNSELSEHYFVVRFPEENNRLLSFADFLLGVVDIVGEITKQEDWLELYASLSENDDDDQVVDTILPRLKQWSNNPGCKFLIMLENMDMIFTHQMKSPKHIHQFRTFLMDSHCATLIGTSPVYFSGLSSVKSPLYDFFDIQILEEMSESMTLDLIRCNLEWDKREALLDKMDDLQPRIQAIHTMTGGNPRLIMMLYELIANDNLLEVKAQFQMLLDKISPFYQDRLKDLAPQERALLETLALMRTQLRTPGNIAKKLRKPPQQASALLKRMTKSGYLVVSKNPKDKRSNLYRIKEGFFDLWLAMSESRAQRRHLTYLVDFFSTFYADRNERQQKREILWKAVQNQETASKIKENHLELIDYLSEVGDKPEKCQSKIELAIHHLSEGCQENAKELLQEVKFLSPERISSVWLTEQACKWAEQGISPDVRKWLDDMVELWRTERTGDLEEAVTIAQKLGVELSGEGLHQVAIDIWKSSLEKTIDKKEKISLLLDISQSEMKINAPEAAAGSLNEAIKLARLLKDQNSEAIAFNNLSEIHRLRGEYEKALDCLEKAISIFNESDDGSKKGTALSNIALVYYDMGDYSSALKYLNESISLRRNVKDIRGESNALYHMSSVYFDKRDLDAALANLDKALELIKQTDDRSRYCTMLFSKGDLHFNRKEYAEAFYVWFTLFKTAKSLELTDALNDLEELTGKLGIERGMEFWEDMLKKETDE